MRKPGQYSVRDVQVVQVVRVVCLEGRGDTDDDPISEVISYYSFTNGERIALIDPFPIRESK